MGPSVLHMKCLLPRAHPSGASNTRRFLHEEVLRHGGLPTVSSLPEFVHFRHFVGLDQFGKYKLKGFRYTYIYIYTGTSRSDIMKRLAGRIFT